MPELPEVETFREQISHYVPLKIDKIVFSKYLKKLLPDQSLPIARLEKKNIEKIERKGKYLYWKLSNEEYLLSHQGMSGRWQINISSPPPAHCHLSIYGHTLTSDTSDKGPISIHYIDPRRFGSLAVLTSKQLQQQLQKLGVDALSPELNCKQFTMLLARYPLRNIKKNLLDQKVIAGIGNYLASESLARAQIHPLRISNSLSEVEIKKLFSAIRKAITLSIENQGLSFDSQYRDAIGNPGKALDHLVVFQRKICGICHKESVKKIVVDGRGTYFCNSCQGET